VAHDLKNVDPVTNLPLAVKVCYNVAGLQFSFQASKFNDIGDYQSGGAGPWLSALCTFMWLTKVRVDAAVACARPSRAPVRRLDSQVVHKMSACLTTMRAVAQLHDKTTSFVDGVVASIGTARMLCFLVMQALRLAVAAMLCYGGAYFIGHTIGLGDLILNCIALEVRRTSLPSARGCARFCACFVAACVWVCCTTSVRMLYVVRQESGARPMLCVAVHRCCARRTVVLPRERCCAPRRVAGVRAQ
jgi:hypothetical protein